MTTLERTIRMLKDEIESISIQYYSGWISENAEDAILGRKAALEEHLQELLRLKSK